mmetsp:Transcript_8602/g.15916  ORF Transcript_8602/g.15916 Transcript_8602/m.15916 type:complete len:211 (-) Transcript_8602:227-859(-)
MRELLQRREGGGVPLQVSASHGKVLQVLVDAVNERGDGSVELRDADASHGRSELAVAVDIEHLQAWERGHEVHGPVHLKTQVSKSDLREAAVRVTLQKLPGPARDLNWTEVRDSLLRVSVSELRSWLARVVRHVALELKLLFLRGVHHDRVSQHIQVIRTLLSCPLLLLGHRHACCHGQGQQGCRHHKHSALHHHHRHRHQQAATTIDLI